MKQIISLILGLIIGATGMFYFFSNQMADNMMLVRESKLGFEQTVSAIQNGANAAGWKIPHTYDIQKSLAKDSLHIKRLKVISLCQPHFAYEIVSQDSNKQISAIMPCRISVYEDQNGKIMITQLNTSQVSSLFGGLVEEVMGKVSREQEDFLTAIIKKE